MDLHDDVAEGVRILEVRGRVDSNTAPTLGERLSGSLSIPGARLVVDLRQLEYISSAGFRILLLAAKRAEEAGSRFALCGLSAKVRQLFDLGGFLDIFTISGSREEGIAAVR